MTTVQATFLNLIQLAWVGRLGDAAERYGGVTEIVSSARGRASPPVREGFAGPPANIRDAMTVTATIAPARPKRRPASAPVAGGDAWVVPHEPSAHPWVSVAAPVIRATDLRK